MRLNKKLFFNINSFNSMGYEMDQRKRKEELLGIVGNKFIFHIFSDLPRRFLYEIKIKLNIPMCTQFFTIYIR